MNSMLVFVGLIFIIYLPFSLVHNLWKKKQLKRKRTDLKQKQRKFVESYLVERALIGCRLNSSERCLLANEIFQKQRLNMTIADCYILLDQFTPVKEPV